MRLLIIRHGETDWNKEMRLQGRTNTPLNDYGRELAEITRDGLKDIKVDYIFSSPLDRAYETASIIRGDREIEIVKDERLIEIGFGINEGLRPEEREPECKLFFTNPELYVPSEGGETLASLCKRTGEFLDEIIRPLSLKYPDKTVIISGHGAMNKGLMLNLKKLSIKDFWDGKLQRNCSVSSYEVSGDEVTVLEEGKLYYEK